MRSCLILYPIPHRHRAPWYHSPSCTHDCTNSPIRHPRHTPLSYKTTISGSLVGVSGSRIHVSGSLVGGAASSDSAASPASLSVGSLFACLRSARRFGVRTGPVRVGFVVVVGPCAAASRWTPRSATLEKIINKKRAAMLINAMPVPSAASRTETKVERSRKTDGAEGEGELGGTTGGGAKGHGGV